MHIIMCLFIILKKRFSSFNWILQFTEYLIYKFSRKFNMNIKSGK